MPRVVFVAGMDESGRDTITDMVVEGYRKNIVKIRHIKLKEFGADILKDALSIEMGKARDNFYKGIESKISSALKVGFSIIVEGPLTLKTEDGYLPLVPKRFFESFSPDIFVLFEVPAGKEANKVDMTQQEINRSYAAMYASLAGSPLKIIEVRKGGVKKAIKDFTNVIGSFLGR